MLSDQLRRAGYYCSNNDKEDYQFEPPKTAWDESGALADYSKREPGQPFFAIYNFQVTHESQLWQRNKRMMRFREGFPDAASLDWDWDAAGMRGGGPQVDEQLEVTVPPYLVDDDSTRMDLRRMYGNVAFMDKQVGFLLDRLEADGLLDSTIIVWYTDHGGPLPREKRLLYDAGLRVPMIVRWPDGYRAGEVDASLVSFVDFLPTTLSMANAPAAEITQGRATFDPKASEKRDYVFAGSDRLDTEYDRIRAVRDGRYKLLRNYNPDKTYYLDIAYRTNIPAMRSLLRGHDAGTLTESQGQWFRPTKDSIELFDTYSDPHELKNLADNPAYAKTRQRLIQALDNHLKTVGDLGAVDERDLVRGWWGGQLQEQPITETPNAIMKGKDLTLRSATAGASIAYRFGSNGPWRPYEQPFTLTKADSLWAIAHRIGYAPSEEVLVAP